MAGPEIARKIPQHRLMLAALAMIVGTGAVPFAEAAGPKGLADINCAGDGKTDDTDCLQHAIDSRPEVQLSSGRTFLVSRSIVVTGPKQLDGNGATITTDERIPVVTISGSNVKVHNLTVGSRTNIRAEGIVLADGASNIELRDDRVVGKFRVGILFGGPNEHDITILNSTIAPGVDGRIGYGLLINPSRMARTGGSPPRALIIKNNTITDVWGDAIEINSPPPVAASNVLIEGNTLSAPFHPSGTAGFCIGLAGTTNVRIVGNKLSRCKWQGMHIEHDASGIVIQNNTIDGTIGRVGNETAWSRNSSGILLLNTNNIKIYGNRINNTANAGIDLAWNPKGANSNITIAGNIVTNAGDYGIRVGGPAARTLGVVVGAADGYQGNLISGSKVADFVGCSSSIRGSDVRLRNCGVQ